MFALVMEVFATLSSREAGEALGRMVGMFLVIGLGLGGGIFFIVSLIMACTRKSRGWVICTVVSGIFALFGIIGTVGLVVRSTARGIAKAHDTRKSSPRITSKDGSCSVETPSTWSDIPELHPDAGIACGNKFQEQYLIVLADSKVDFAGDLQAHDRVTVQSMNEAMTGTTIAEPEARVIGGCPALYRRISGTAGNIRVVYHRASVESADSFYQIITWTLASRDAEATPRLLEAIHSFIPKAGAPVPANTGDTGSRVIAIIAAQLNLAKPTVKPESRIIEDLGADSLDLVEIVMTVEEAFGVSMPDESAEKIKTVADLTKWLDTNPVKSRVVK